MKLTNEIRKQIVDAALAKSELPKMRAKVEKDLQALAKAAYKAAVSIPAGIRKLPPEVSAEWLRRDTHIEISAPGFQRYNHYRSNSPDRQFLCVTIKLDDPVVVPQRFGMVKADEHPHVAKLAAEVHTDHLAANAYEDDLRRSLRAITSSANTSEQLLRTWPEGKKFLPAEKPKSRALVDTKTVIEVNEKLGLQA